LAGFVCYYKAKDRMHLKILKPEIFYLLTQGQDAMHTALIEEEELEKLEKDQQANSSVSSSKKF